MKHYQSALCTLALTSALVATLAGCGGEAKTTGITPQIMADALHTVLETDRTVYTRLIVNRLMLEEKGVFSIIAWSLPRVGPFTMERF